MDKRKTQSVKRKVKVQSLKFLVLSFSFAFFALHFTLPFCFAQDKIIAIVNNEVITQKDLNDFVSFMRMQLSAQYSGRELEDRIQDLKLNLLDKLIEDRLILQEANKEKLDVDKSRIMARIKEIGQKYPSEAEFERALAKQGLVQADLELKIKEQLLTYRIIDLKIRRKITIKPSEITDFYEKNKGEFKSPEQREFFWVLAKDEHTVNAAYFDLKTGKTVEDVSKAYAVEVSQLIASRGELKKEAEDVLFTLNIDEVSKPIKTEEQFCIFVLKNIIPSQQEGIKESQDAIYNFLFEKKIHENLLVWLDELKKKSYLKITPD